MSQQNDVQELIRKGIEAARGGDKAAARALFEQAVQLDEGNEKGWFWLASVVDSDDERRLCLNNVLQINPGNDRARRMLEKLEQKQDLVGELREEVAPGITRQQMRTIMIVGGGAIAVIVVIFLVLTVSITRQRAEAETQATRAVVQQTEVINQTSTAIAAEIATQVALASPTPTEFIPVGSPLPPTWTPTPEATEVGVAGRVTLPPPQGLTGRIAGWAGRDIQNVGYLPIVSYDLAQNGQYTTVGTQLGRDVDIHPNGQRVIYTRYDQILFTTTIDAVNLNGSESELVSERWRGFAAVLTPQMPHFSADGGQVVLVATDQETSTTQIYLLNMADLPPGANPTTVPSPLRQLTTDGATYTFPAISPDGTRVVAVRNDISGANPGPDLVIIDVATGALTPLTTDLNTFVESAPRWSPDGTQIVYQAAPSTEPGNNDIALRPANGSGVPILPVRDAADDVRPVFSPDGRYLAFSSNRNGAYDIYIYSLADDLLYQLTNTDEPDFPGGWWQPAG